MKSMKLVIPLHYISPNHIWWNELPANIRNLSFFHDMISDRITSLHGIQALISWTIIRYGYRYFMIAMMIFFLNIVQPYLTADQTVNQTIDWTADWTVELQMGTRPPSGIPNHPCQTIFDRNHHMTNETKNGRSVARTMSITKLYNFHSLLGVFSKTKIRISCN